MFYILSGHTYIYWLQGNFFVFIFRLLLIHKSTKDTWKIWESYGLVNSCVWQYKLG